jgi:glycyl-tRNA synthetase
MQQLKFSLRCYYEDKDTIGRRYRRQDAIGTPYCVTIDHQTLQDDTLTVRHRDTMLQERVPISGLLNYLTEACSVNALLKAL